MGGCTSMNNNIIHPSRRSSKSSKKNTKCKSIQRKISQSSNQLLCHHLDQIHSEVENVIEEFEQIQEYYNCRLESILEQNSIFNQFYNKLELLKKITKENNRNQLEKLILIVHRACTYLPKIEVKLISLKDKLQQGQNNQIENPEQMQRKYKILYKIDEISFDQFTKEILQWDDILRKNVNLTYEQIKTQKRMSQDYCFRTQITSNSNNHIQSSIFSQQNIKQKKNAVSNSQMFIASLNRTQSTLN